MDDDSSQRYEAFMKQLDKSGPVYWSAFDSDLPTETSSTHSTNSTVSGLPGPGRTMDHLFGILGRKMENTLLKSRMTPFASLETSLVLERIPTHSTNSTVSGLPGPGRTLDHLLGIWGRKLEKWLARKAHKAGLGPDATKARLYSRRAQSISEPFTPKEAKKIAKDCQRLLGYMQSSQAVSSRCQAMSALYILATSDIRLREFFVKIGAYSYLCSMHNAIMYERNNKHDSTLLLSICRRALVSVEENTINALGKEVSYMMNPSQTMTANRFAEVVVLWDRLFTWNRSTTHEHRDLAKAYWYPVATKLQDSRPKFDQWAMTRSIYELTLKDDRLLTSSALSPLHPYSHPEVETKAHKQGSDESASIYLEIGDVTYVLQVEALGLVLSLVKCFTKSRQGTIKSQTITGLQFSLPIGVNYRSFPEMLVEEVDGCDDHEDDEDEQNDRAKQYSERV